MQLAKREFLFTVKEVGIQTRWIFREVYANDGETIPGTEAQGDVLRDEAKKNLIDFALEVWTIDSRIEIGQVRPFRSGTSIAVETRLFANNRGAVVNYLPDFVSHFL